MQLIFVFNSWLNKSSIDTHLGCFQYFSIQTSSWRSVVYVCILKFPC